MNRRDFMKTTVLAGAAAAVAGGRAEASGPQGAKDRLQVGFIGCGARAHQLMDAVVAMKEHRGDRPV